MIFSDLMCISFRQIIRHRRRYWGVVLAISLGIAGLITVIMASRDFKRNLNNDLTLIGGVTVIKASFDNNLTYMPLGFQGNTIAALKKIPGVELVNVLGFQKGKTILAKGKSYTFTIMAIDEPFWRVRGFWAQTGRLFGQDAVDKRKRECVLGEILAKKIFGHTNVAGLTVDISGEPYRVMGVLGGITDSGLASSAYLPVSTVADRFGLLVDHVDLRCATIDDVASVAAAIPEVVKRNQLTEELQVRVIWEALTRVQRIFWWTELFIYIAIGATLLLGGVGVWNVMMAAVRSRTREIGLKKAVGADDMDILAQFLAEALGLSLIASFLGIFLGRISVECIFYNIGTRVSENVFFVCVALGIGFGVFLGIGAGLLPSIQASRMDVVEAVRYE